MAADEVTQRVAAVLAADAVGYSRLMADDEKATIEALDAARAVFTRHIEANRGRVVDTAGDSVLAVFETTNGAIRASVAIQNGLSVLNDDLMDARRMRFRIGLHLGDIQEKSDGTVYGDGVNVAARLEALSEPGGIAVSDAVRGSVRGGADVTFEPLGEQSGKNLDRPIEAYRLMDDGDETRERKPEGRGNTSATRSTGGPKSPSGDTNFPEAPSIAVLPFDNLGGDAKFDYLADGMTEAITATLSHARGMAVISRSSSYTLKGQPVSARDAANRFGIRYLLEGSIQTAGNRVRITAQLIDAIDDRHLMSERFDRSLADIFSLQDEISLNVASALQVSLTEGPHAKLWRGGTENLDAWSLHQQGLVAQRKYTKEDNRIARGFFSDAVALDPDFALGWVYVGWTHRIDSSIGFSEDREEPLRLASENVARGLGIDPGLADALVLEATVTWARRQFDMAAEQAFRATEAAPNHSVVLALAATPMAFCGQPEFAISLMQRAEKLSPYPPAWYSHVTALANLFVQDYDATLHYSAEALERGDTTMGTVLPIFAYSGLGEMEKAYTSFKAYREIDPDFSVLGFKQWVERSNPMRESDFESWVGLLRAAGVPKNPGEPHPLDPTPE